MNCIFYASAYCMLQREHFCEYNEQLRCPQYLVEKEDNSLEEMTSVLDVVNPLDTYNPIEEQLKAKEWATGRLSDVQGIKIVRERE